MILTEIYKDILHLYYTDYVNTIPSSLLEKISPKNRIKRVYKNCRHFFKLLIEIPKDLLFLFKTKNNENNIWLYTVSKNNSDVLSFFKKESPLPFKTKLVAIADKKNVPHFDFFYRLPFKWFFYIKYFIVIKALKKKDYLRTKRLSDIVFSAIGSYESCRMILKKNKPKLIVFTNDININARSLMWAAKSLNIKTAYIQHASVTNNFPPLKFDLSLLEGQDASLKYKNIKGTSSKIELVGMVKFDEITNNKNLSEKVYNVGVCSSTFDNLEKVISLLKKIIEIKGINITYRAHPKLENENSIIQSLPIKISKGKEESIFEFLSNQDLIIANDSNIHLEATLLNLVSIAYNLSDSNDSDYYGFIKNGMIELAPNISFLIELINKYQKTKPTNIYLKAKYYNASINSEFEGQSAKKIFISINNLLNDSKN